MPIETTWDDDARTILRWEFSNPWTIEEFTWAQKATFNHEIPPNSRLDIIVHLPSNLTLPSGLFSRLSSTLKRQQAEFSQAEGLVVFVAEGVLNQAFLTTFIRVNQNAPWKLCEEINGAREMIMSHRQTARRA